MKLEKSNHKNRTTQYSLALETEIEEILYSTFQNIKEYFLEIMKIFTGEFSYLTHDLYVVIQKYDRCLTLFVLK